MADRGKMRSWISWEQKKLFKVKWKGFCRNFQLLSSKEIYNVANTNFKNVEFLTHVDELVRFLSKTDLTKDHWIKPKVFKENWSKVSFFLIKEFTKLNKKIFNYKIKIKIILQQQHERMSSNILQYQRVTPIAQPNLEIIPFIIYELMKLIF